MVSKLYLVYVDISRAPCSNNPLGAFFYKNDTQETDIEWLSDAASLSNQGTRKLWFTNQDADLNGVKTYNAVTPPANPTTTEHEYRLDWTPGRVRWFVDGVEIWNTTSDVPNTTGPWVFNNWSNGDNGWSAGPPAIQADFKIKDIYIYYNTASA
ncbi:beta-glucanase [Colletotrichum spaethianum]|uniref:Beta-glucanase n=1 Tax=Colletotrichum spaethianum TaxID=700344 RepID=A0AA37UJK5_9PEZI|nr:beta-glucanase [Colletotrichum spaethianum]GKT48211.1 beta-glucanase [Colletotrichum spaethianum]